MYSNNNSFNNNNINNNRFRYTNNNNNNQNILNNNKIKINVNKINLGLSHQQILNNLFEVNYMYNKNTVPQLPNPNIPYHYQINNSVSFLVLNSNDILNLIQDNNESLNFINNHLLQFYNYNLNKESFIIIESSVNQFQSNPKESIKTNLKIKQDFNKFQIKFLKFNFKYLFSSSLNETFDLMLKCIENYNNFNNNSNNNNNHNNNIINKSHIDLKQDTINSLFSTNKKVKFLLSTNNISINQAKELLNENQNNLSKLIKSLEILNDLDTTNFNNNNNNNNQTTHIENNNNTTTTTNNTQINKSLKSFLSFIEKDNLLNK